MTLMTCEEEEILHKVRDIKTETANMWEILHAVRRLETKCNAIEAVLNAPAAPTPPSAPPEPEV